MRKKIPKFRTEAEERKFWESHDSTQYVDWSKAKAVTFPNLQPSTEVISLRLSVSMLEGLKVVGWVAGFTVLWLVGGISLRSALLAVLVAFIATWITRRLSS